MFTMEWRLAESQMYFFQLACCDNGWYEARDLHSTYSYLLYVRTNCFTYCSACLKPYIVMIGKYGGWQYFLDKNLSIHHHSSAIVCANNKYGEKRNQEFFVGIPILDLATLRVSLSNCYCHNIFCWSHSSLLFLLEINEKNLIYFK